MYIYNILRNIGWRCEDKSMAQGNIVLRFDDKIIDSNEEEDGIIEINS
jgi:hypothetical protein